MVIVNTKLTDPDEQPREEESKGSSQSRAVYIAPRLERSGSFVTVTGASLPIESILEGLQ